ncbi:DUF2927 domain-containing protein [Thalassovita taeanensis]|uniref:DUF2927 domain-containing protein n=1 Tax=Thalassovita taeanensis TaxID=657014 RepID=A0A1H9G3B3_9RHOB|nr:DUF2927 domain-containing protein [Thalassovita taeanensis]SEQ44571.1 Protein of unknown function [Thalassovita taeanensis]
MRCLKAIAPTVVALGGLLLSAACAPVVPATPRTSPQARPAGLVRPAAAPTQATPSAQSKALGTYYARVQADLLAQGLLRTDGGGPDTPYSSDDLLRNFEKIAFFDEYERGAGLRTSRGGPGRLRRWDRPVRFSVEFGASVPEAQRTSDRAEVQTYAARLARVTGHPISVSPDNANFFVLIMGEDDRAAAMPRVRQIVPNINPASLSILEDIPRSIHCLVIAFSGSDNDHIYRKAIALVRAEHPDLLRKSCLHEELAQGLGLANDSPQARPSIFNDDDEFALLTTHDEMLLKMLYDPRVSAGMSPDEARPILRQIASDLISGPS